MTRAIPEQRGTHHGMEFDGSGEYSLHARYAAQLGGTVYSVVPGPDERLPAGINVQRDRSVTTVATSMTGLSETRRQGSFVTRVDTAANFADGALVGAMVRFYRPGQGHPVMFLETALAAASHVDFMTAMSALPRDRQGDINMGLQSLGVRLGLAPEALRPAAHLQEEMQIQRAVRQEVHGTDEGLREPNADVA